MVLNCKFTRYLDDHNPCLYIRDLLYLLYEHVTNGIRITIVYLSFEYLEFLQCIH